MREKEKYVTLEMEITEFENKDVITTSVPDPGEDGLPFVPK